MDAGAWFGLLSGGAFCLAIAVLFHHYSVRISVACSWLSRGAVLVDVDAAGDLARHHPWAAVSIPLEDLARRAHELGGHDKPVVVCARSWRRGARAVYELRAIGFYEVMNAAGLHTKAKLGSAASRAAEERKNKEESALTPKVSEA